MSIDVFAFACSVPATYAAIWLAGYVSRIVHERYLGHRRHRRDNT